MGYCIFLRKGETHTAPSTGILASDLAVGDIVKLTENGTPVEYIVVNQGIPTGGESLYDSSCDGCWLLRKDIHSKRAWNESNVNIYETSTINTWLNGDFFNGLGSVEQTTIKQVKIPYRKDGGEGGTDQSGANGLLCKIFLLSGFEVGYTTSDTTHPMDGVKLDYFESGIGTSAENKRIANYNGSATNWWLRSPRITGAGDGFYILSDGRFNYGYVANSYGIRPALILPSTALFDKDTKILKG